VLADDKNCLHKVKEQIREYLISLRLKLHSYKCQIFPVKDGTDFLGYRVFPNHRLVRQDSIIRFQRRMYKFQEDYRYGKISLLNIRQSIQSWLGHVSHADSCGLKRQLLKRFVFSK
jgi:RNA-directed DNA polymerase